MRLDQLVSKKFNISRTKAASLIEGGFAEVFGKVIKKISSEVDEDAEITLQLEGHYVGRGADKLASIFPKFKINPSGLTVADIGASTGGFSEYLLTQGAAKIYAIDVGHDQLAPKLRDDPRVINMEGVNIRSGVTLSEKVPLLVSDLSFISLTLVTAQMADLVSDNGDLVFLFKPQFEVGREFVGRSGIVHDQKRVEQVLADYLVGCRKMGLIHQQTIPSALLGKDGNQEYFIHFKKGQP